MSIGGDLTSFNICW